MTTPGSINIDTVSKQLTMRLFVFVRSIIIFTPLMLVPNAFAKGAKGYDDQQLIDAGCKFDMNERYGGDVPRWHGWGTLLQKGACIEDTYSTTIVPEKGITKAYCTIANQMVRDIDSKNKQLTIDITFTRRWVDPGIITNFSKVDLKNGGIDLEIEQQHSIWRPHAYIYNLSDYKTFSDSVQVKSFFLMPFNETVLANDTREERRKDSNHTVVELTQEAKVKIYCNFDLYKYPMDKQKCRFRFGSRSAGTRFVLLEDSNTQHNTEEYKTEDFNVKISFINNTVLNGMSMVGFDIEMHRILKPYIMEYYLPCVASILVSHIGFLIPVKSIPGRAALLVTQFLSLINLFIAGMVIVVIFYQTFDFK